MNEFYSLQNHRTSNWEHGESDLNLIQLFALNMCCHRYMYIIILVVLLYKEKKAVFRFFGTLVQLLGNFLLGRSIVREHCVFIKRVILWVPLMLSNFRASQQQLRKLQLQKLNVHCHHSILASHGIKNNVFLFFKAAIIQACTLPYSPISKFMFDTIIRFWSPFSNEWHPNKIYQN